MEYEKYEEKTLEGKHGQTAQFYMMYIRFVKYYLLLNDSIRNADFDLLKFVLPTMNNFFFIFNQQNNAKYLVKYHDNLLNIDKTHHGLKVQFEKRSFGIIRTEKSYSQQPVD